MEFTLYRKFKEVLDVAIMTNTAPFDFLCRKGGQWYVIEAKIAEGKEPMINLYRKNCLISLDIGIRLRAFFAHIIKSNGDYYVIEGKKLFLRGANYNKYKRAIRIKGWLQYAYTLEDWFKIVKGEKKRKMKVVK